MPGRELCEVLEKFFERELQMTSVHNESSMENFMLMPYADRRVRNPVQSASSESEHGVIAKLGDTSFTIEDARHLVRLEN